MDPEFLPYLARRGIFTPALVSLWFLVRLWREGELYGWKEVVFPTWFIAALVAQLWGSNIAIWIAGVLGQVVLAVALGLKDKIDQIY
jgi:hypothetical protein